MSTINKVYLHYAPEQSVQSGYAWNSITVPAGIYLLVGYVNVTDTTAAAWLANDGETPTSSSSQAYLKIENLKSFAKIVETETQRTYMLKNLNGKAITPYNSMYLAAITIQHA